MVGQFPSICPTLNIIFAGYQGLQLPPIIKRFNLALAHTIGSEAHEMANIFCSCLGHKIQHIPGRNNNNADPLSRLK